MSKTIRVALYSGAVLLVTLTLLNALRAESFTITLLSVMALFNVAALAVDEALHL